MDLLLSTLDLAIEAAWWIVIANVLMSWLINFQVLNINQPLVYKLWTTLQRILEPVYAPLRRLIPPMGGMDFSPMIVLIGLMILRSAF